MTNTSSVLRTQLALCLYVVQLMAVDTTVQDNKSVAIFRTYSRTYSLKKKCSFDQFWSLCHIIAQEEHCDIRVLEVQG